MGHETEVTMNQTRGAEIIRDREKTKLIRIEALYQKPSWTGITSEKFIDNLFYRI